MKTIAIACLFGLGSLLAASVSAADHAKPSPRKEPKADSVARQQAESEFKALKLIADDKKRDREERIDAILKIGTLDLPNAADYLLENIRVEFPRNDFRADDDKLRVHPYFYSLRRKEEKALPAVLQYVKQERDENQLAEIARLLEYLEAADETIKCKEMLMRAKATAKRDPDAAVFRKNIDRLTVILSKKMD